MKDRPTFSEYVIKSLADARRQRLKEAREWIAGLPVTTELEAPEAFRPEDIEELLSGLDEA